MLKQMSISEIRKKINSLKKELSSNDIISITNHGKKVFALIRWDMYESITETLDILTDEAAYIDLKKGIKQMNENKLVDFEHFKKSFFPL